MAARGDRPVRKNTGRALDGKTRGVALVEQKEPRGRLGAPLGKGERRNEVREARSRPRGRDRDHRRHLQESLDIMRNSGFQGGREDNCGQPAEGLRTGNGQGPKPSA